MVFIMAFLYIIFYKVYIITPFPDSSFIFFFLKVQQFWDEANI